MTEWNEARRLAAEIGTSTRPAPVVVPLGAAADCVLAAPLRARVALPPHASSAMDGWAVAGDPPWLLGDHIDAGDAPHADTLLAGTARPIGTGAPIPHGAQGVLRAEHGRIVTRHDSLFLERRPPARHDEPRAGEHIRPAGEEADIGDELVPAGCPLTPVRLALAAAAGYDEVLVVPRPHVELLVFGNELAAQGLPHPGSRRDAISPAFPGFVAALGGELGTVGSVPDRQAETVEAIAASSAAVLITTGGTALGRSDHARAAAAALGIRLVVDGVAMRPGHPTMLGVRDDGRPVLFLPGNPLAALLGMLALGGPLLAGMAGRQPWPRPGLRLAEGFPTHAEKTRLVAYRLTDAGAHPLAFQGSGMLRGLAAADGVAVIPPGGGEVGSEVQTLALPD